MHYSYSVEKANEFASEALERIHRESLMPIPENYELWYVYYASLNPEVTRAIDILEASNQKITDERCQELHRRFLSNRRENENVRDAGDKIQSTIEDVSSVVSNVKAATSQYNEKLDSVAAQLSSGMDAAELENVLQEVAANTKDMMKHNQALEESLSQSSVAMAEMQRDLDTARKEALTDGLTDLANRKSFDLEIERIMREAEAEGKIFSLLMMDIDHFKSFNDSYGHQVGDQVLRLVARTMIDGVKGRDVAARYGGEEFAIILPETNLKGGLMVGEFLRKAVESKEVVNRNSGEKLGRITLSGGVAQYCVGEKIDDLISRADAALYTAKHNGRNQIAAAPAPSQKKAAS